jgi:hypothetical protein
MPVLKFATEPTVDLLKNRAAESLTDLGEGRAFGIREAHTGWKMSSEDAILRCQVLILEQKLLIDEAGNVGQQTSPFVLCHGDHPIINSAHSSG